MLLAGPFAGRLLGDMGADVIKVEPPGKPDPLRDWGHARYRDRSLWWPVQSRNKRCITLNLREPKGQELLLELVRVADVDLRELPARHARALEPRLRPARRGQPGHHPRAHLRLRADRARTRAAPGSPRSPRRWAGLRYINGFPDEPPPRTGISLGDSLAAMFATQGILAALYQRDVLGDGRGQVIDVSLMEASFALLESTVPEYDRLGVVRQPAGTGLKGVAPSNIFKSRDDTLGRDRREPGQRLHAGSARRWGTPELADDPRFATHLARGENQEEIEGIIADWAAQHDARDIDALLNEHGVVCGPIYTVADIFEDPQFQRPRHARRARGSRVRSYIGPGIVPKFSETPGAVRWSATWEEGSHNRGDLLRAARPLRVGARRAAEEGIV